MSDNSAWACLLAAQRKFTKGCSASPQGASGRRQDSSVVNARTRRAVHALVVWAGGLSMRGTGTTPISGLSRFVACVSVARLEHQYVWLRRTESHCKSVRCKAKKPGSIPLSGIESPYEEARKIQKVPTELPTKKKVTPLSGSQTRVRGPGCSHFRDTSSMGQNGGYPGPSGGTNGGTKPTFSSVLIGEFNSGKWN